MIQFQKCYTTYEQSKKLLELGLSADSADMFYDRNEVEIDESISVYLISPYDSFKKFGIEFYLPCWSVGRLIEILKTCIINRNELHEIFEELEICIDEIATLIQIFKEYSEVIDFSKLEE